MTAPSSIDPARFLHEQLASASPDLLRSMLTTFINTLMSAEADALCGAGYGQRSDERTNTSLRRRRVGRRHRGRDRSPQFVGAVVVGSGGRVEGLGRVGDRYRDRCFL